MGPYSTSASTLLNNLISYWKLDETSGLRLDSAGTNDLTDNNTVGFAAGIISNAADFIPANIESLSHVNNSDFDLGNVDFTVAGWMFKDLAGVAQSVFNKDNLTLTSGYLLFVGVANTSVFGIRTPTPVTIINTTSITTGTWFFYVAWHDSVANTINLQINNGAIFSTATGGAFSPSNTEPFRLGADNSLATRWDGRLDETGLWHRVLTAAERTALYNGGAGLTYPF